MMLDTIYFVTAALVCIVFFGYLCTIEDEDE